MMLLLATMRAPAANATCVAATDGRYSLAPYTEYTEAENASSLAVGDMNGDLLDDVVTGIGLGNLDASSVVVFLQQSDHALVASPAVEVPGRTGIGSLSVGDLDEDGDLDVVTSGEEGVYTLWNDGLGALSEAVLLGGTVDIGVRVLDLDEDGHLDILTLAFDSIGIAWGDGTGTFAVPAVLIETDGWPVDPAALHVGTDVRNDLLVAEQNARATSQWTQDTHRGFAYEAGYDIDADSNGGSIAAGDLDGDGLADILRGSTGDLSLFYQDGAGFAPFVTLPSTLTPTDLLIADVDKSGVADILVNHEGCIGVYLQDEHGFGAEDLYELPLAHGSGYEENEAMGTGEFSGDDCTDVAVAVPLAGLAILPGTGCKDVYKDTDGDQVPDAEDGCPELYDPSQGDRDADGLGDVCDGCPNDADDGTDTDGDGVPDGCDGCPGVPDGPDSDGDQIPDVCDACPDVQDDGADGDRDGLPDACDACPEVPDDGADSDDDSVPDACDVCPDADDRLDSDSDGVPDDCEPADSAPPLEGDSEVAEAAPSAPEPACGCATNRGSGAPMLAAALCFLLLRRRTGCA